MWSLAVLHRHALYGDYRVTDGVLGRILAPKAAPPVSGVDRLCETSVVATPNLDFGVLCIECEI